MPKENLFDHVYDNINWKINDKKEGRSGPEKRQYIYVGVGSVLSISLLVNAVLGCLYFMKDTNTFLHCQPVRNCLNSSNPSCTFEKNVELANYCPDLPEQWVKGNGSFYVFSSHTQTWNSSRQRCQSHGGDLVIINDTQEKDFLAQRLCITGESNLHWTGTSEKNWEGLEQVNCAIINGYTQEDALCQREERSICEIPCL